MHTHTYMHTYLHTYIHIYILLLHTFLSHLWCIFKRYKMMMPG